MKNYTNAELGRLDDIGEKYENGKAFLHDLLSLSSCEISVSAMPKGAKLPFKHKHKQNEEIYIFLKGEGVMTLGDNNLEFKEGSCIKVLPNESRTIEAKTDILYICVQAKTNSLQQFGLEDAELC